MKKPLILILGIMFFFVSTYTGCGKPQKYKTEKIKCCPLPITVEDTLLAYIPDSLHLKKSLLVSSLRNCLLLDSQIQIHVFNFWTYTKGCGNWCRLYYCYFTMFDIHDNSYLIQSGDDFYNPVKLKQWISFMKSHNLDSSIVPLIPLLYEDPKKESYDITEAEVLQNIGFSDSIVNISKENLANFILYTFETNHEQRYKPYLIELSLHQKVYVPYKDYYLFLLKDKRNKEYYIQIKSIDSMSYDNDIDIEMYDYLNKNQLQYHPWF